MALGLGRWQTCLLTLSLACGGHTLGSSDPGEGENEPSVGSGGGNQGEGGRPASQAGRPGVVGGSAGRPGAGSGGVTPGHPGGATSTPAGGNAGTPEAGAPGVPVCIGDPNDSCIHGCDSDLNYGSTLICYEGIWRCPLGDVRLSTCAPDSCAATSWSCCDDMTGRAQYAACGSDARRRECLAPLRQIESGGYCSPNGDVCTEGTSCPQLGYECHFPRGSCACELGIEGLTWTCAFLI